ncbi:hypothetical protein F0Q45_13055 [Mycobacterium simiae]|uniref:HTH cro/C1-type domain-containing protein n=1 Tax=Mycobacterium simiae TaxID=1784 RepID=A0A5B1BMH9_MYCSI|nr:hypothetical protein [Mycobacterium simiae]KAA1249807.1 hypothetical protein F0Q45_13055 [Mycobacterium simiae]
MNTWESDHAAAIGRKVRDLRGKQSAAWLSEKTEELGLKLTRQTITDLENGRRRYVTTAELVILAAALDVPAVALVYPDLPDGNVEVLPGQHVSATVALLRFTGEKDSSPASDLGRLAQLSRERFDKQIRHKVANEFLDERLKSATDDEVAEQIFAVIDKAEGLRDLERRIREIPGSVIDDA